MYKLLIRPFLFLFSPERVHHWIMFLLKAGQVFSPILWFLALLYKPSIKLQKAVRVFGITFSHPVGLAAGFDKNAEVMHALAYLGFSHVEIGSVTPKPQPGNPRPRLFRLPKNQAIINRMGFNNDGVDVVAKRLEKRPKNIIIGGNIGKNTATPLENSVQDYLYCFQKLYGKVDYFVVNVSCPNVKGLHKLQDKDALLSILSALVDYRKLQQQYIPVLLKIAPDLTPELIDDTLAVIQQCGLDGIVATNTSTSRDGLDAYSSAFIEKIGAGGLSGAPLTNRSTDVIQYIHQKTNGNLPIIGLGGIMNETHALDKMNAGASLIQVYTGFIYQGPCFIRSILYRLQK